MSLSSCYRPTLAVGALILALGATAALARNGDDSFTFAAKRAPPWNLTATTIIEWPRSESAAPLVASIVCRGESPQIEFEMDGSGELRSLRIRFLGNPDADGLREELPLLGDRLWLYLEGERWEYANIRRRPPRFSNVQYPEPEKSDVTILGWIGYQAIRKNDGEPWVNLTRIYERLITARRIEWSFKSRDWSAVDQTIPENRLPGNWQATRYRVDNTGLQSAVSWCVQQVSSDAAYVLPDDVLKAR